MSVQTQTTSTENKTTPPFQHLIIIKPLGFMYGSAGRFLSPDNLVGTSGSSFPPSAATLSGVFAHHFSEDKETLKKLQLAGPFWSFSKEPNNFFVPTPMNCLVKDNKLKYLMTWHEEKWQTYQQGKWDIPPDDKFQNGTWVSISDWEKLKKNQADLSKISVYSVPWKFSPHLHPELTEDERKTEGGRLFLENAVELDPNTCLTYLSNTELPNGWYRFGGEGHLVEIESIPMGIAAETLLNQPLKTAFSLINPAVWGSNRFSFRAPNMDQETGQLFWGESEVKALLTKRPIPHRYRLGNRREGHQKYQPKLLSRGRYAVPSGTVYILDKPLNTTWQNGDESWFPREGYYSMKRWGCGLALPLESAIL